MQNVDGFITKLSSKKGDVDILHVFLRPACKSRLKIKKLFWQEDGNQMVVCTYTKNKSILYLTTRFHVRQRAWHRAAGEGCRQNLRSNSSSSSSFGYDKYINHVSARNQTMWQHEHTNQRSDLDYKMIFFAFRRLKPVRRQKIPIGRYM